MVTNKLGSTLGNYPRSRRRGSRRQAGIELLEHRVLLSTTGVTGSGVPFNNTQPTLGMSYIIALQGVFPPRSDEAGSAADWTLNNLGPGGSGEPFIGEVKLWAGTFAPRGWAFTNGQLLPIAQNTALFSILGTTYGGNGTTNFALPDLRNRVAVGMGQGPGLANVDLGQVVGLETVTLTTSNLPAHTHTIPGGTTLPTGDGQAFTNVQLALGLNFLVSLQATFEGLGEVAPFAGNFAPVGWTFADGSLLPISENQALFQQIGTTYGGDGVNTFAVPDMRGRVWMGDGAGPGLTNRVLGQQAGIENVPLSINQLPAHSHTLPGGGSTGLTGNGGAFTNLQPFLALNPIIALQGIFPSFNDDPMGDPLPDITEPFIGDIAMMGHGQVPNGWASADGQLLQINQNQALFALLGTTYGGNGTTTFALPDLRGRVAAGTGNVISLGAVVGTENVTLTVGQLPAHTHEINDDPDDQISEAIAVGVESSSNNTISSIDDVDMYAFTVTAGQQMTFDVDGRDTILRIFDATGGQLAFNNGSNPPIGPGPEGTEFEPFIRHIFTTAGTYFVGVSSYDNSSYDPLTGNGDTGGNDTGTYELHLGTQRVLDDGEPGYTFVGTWTAASGGFTGPLGGTTGDTKFITGDATADRFARAQFTGLADGSYRVLATYRVATNHSTAANYTMKSGVVGTIFGTGQLNQRLAPNDLTLNTKGFEQIGLFNVTGGTLLVELSDLDPALGRIYADGFVVERVGVLAPVSNQAPVLNDQSLANVAENTANGILIGTVFASDADAGQTLTFAITSGNTNGAFAINTSSGQITVANVAALDFETTSSFALTVQVTDNGTPALSDTGFVTITLNNVNEAPVLADQSLPALAENSPNGTLVGTVAAADPDAGQTQTFSITGGNTNGAFAINASTGQITVASAAALDFETTPIFALTVQVADNGSPSLNDTGIVTINLTDVNESVADPDDQISEAVTRSTESSTANTISDTNDVDMYAITVTAGQTVNIDVDGRDTVLRIFDAAGTALAINTGSNPPVGLGPEGASFEPFIRHTFATAGTYFIGVSSFANAGYDPLAGTGDGGGVDTGSYTLHLGTTRVIDDGEPGYTFVGTWTNGSGGFTGPLGGTTGDTKFVTGDATADRFARAEFTNLTPGTYRVLATYRVGTTNSLVASYTLKSAVGGTVLGGGTLNQRLTPNDITINTKGFELIGNATITGTTLVVELSDLDPALGRIYADGFAIERIDGTPTGGGNAAPVLNDQALPNINENSANGTVVGTVAATDADSGQTKTFSITGGNTNGAFAINPSNGQITVANASALNFEVTPVFNLTVQVTDNGTPNLSDTGVVTINLNDITEGGGTFVIDDGEPGYTFVGTWTNGSGGFTGPLGGTTGDTKYVTGDTTGDRIARASFTGLTPGNVYQVLATYRVGTTNSLAAQYSVRDTVGSPVYGTASLNQRLAPNDVTHGGKGFETLLNVRLGSGVTTAVIELSDLDLTGGRIYADAFMLVDLGQRPATSLASPATIPWSAPKQANVWI